MGVWVGVGVGVGVVGVVVGVIDVNNEEDKAYTRKRKLVLA